MIFTIERLRASIGTPAASAAACAALASVLALGAAGPAVAAPDAARLGEALTPLGGERAASADGSVPAWEGDRQEQQGWAWGQSRLDGWKHKDDKPLYSIDASNVDKYAEHLSPAQIALLKQLKGYRMDVYPTRRSCGAPDFVAQNTKKNVGFAKVAADGATVQDAYVPGIPFPMPESGIEAMLNLTLRYRGVANEWKRGTTLVSPRKGSDEWINYGYDQTFFFPWGAKGSRKLSELGMAHASTYFTYTSPAALAGQAGIITDFFDKAGTEAFYYFPGQRRVRRLPSYAYDAPQIGFENEYAIDETQVFIGALDRFDWKLAGRKELLVPYNAFGAYDFKGDQKQIAQRDFIDPQHRRYEMHRVWVIEATVKAGVRHLAPKRTFYLDEDSWNILMAEDYDGQGKLWKLREGYVIPVYEIGACDVAAFAQYNLVDGRYLFDFHAAGTGVDAHWYTEASGPRMTKDFYTPERLRALSER